MKSLMIDYDKVLNKKSRDYYIEVISSFENENYRAAVVMLYTVAVCDVLFKLKDLSELYGDGNATELLKKYGGHQSGGRQGNSKSSWEFELIKDANKAGLIDSVLFSEIETVYKYRNLAAHPILDQNYELCSPSREMALALIITVYERLLSQPPLYISTVIDSMSEELSKRKTILLSDNELFSSSINDKYLSHLNDKYTIQVFKAFWKFCFILENEEAKENRIINLAVLRLILDSKIELIEQDIRCDSVHYNCSVDDECISCLVILFSEYPKIYKVMRNEVKTIINSFLSRASNYRAISWFMYDDLYVFLEKLKQERECVLDSFFVKRINSFFEYNGKTEQLFDYYILCYSNSFSFESAKSRWSILLSPIIEKLSKSQLIRLIEISNENNQIYNSFHSSYANTRIITALLSFGPIDINLQQYHHFDFDTSILNDKQEDE